MLEKKWTVIKLKQLLNKNHIQYEKTFKKAQLIQLACKHHLIEEEKIIINDKHFKITHIEEKNNRDYMEDRFSYKEQNNCLMVCVFDGHGGDAAVQFLQANFIDCFFTNFNESKDIPLSLNMTFQKCDIDFKSFKPKDKSGSTIVGICLYNNNIWSFHTGDSQCIILNQSQKTIDFITTMHDASNKEYVQKVKSRFYKVNNIPHSCTVYYQRVCGIEVNMLNVFGDYNLRCSDCYSRELEIHTIPLNTSDNYQIILATDGLFDVIPAKEVAQDFLKNPSKDLEYYKDKAIHSPIGDNITIVNIHT